MFSFLYIDYYFIFTIFFTFLIIFISNSKDLQSKFCTINIKIYLLLNLIKIMTFFILITLINLNLAYSLVSSNTLNYNFIIAFKLLFFVFLYFYLYYFYYYSKFTFWNNYEYFFIFIVACFALSILPQALNFIYFYVILELYTLSICSAIIIKKITRKLSESAFNYLIINGVSSCIILFGLSFIYFSTGIIDFNEINKFCYVYHKIIYLNTLNFGYFLVILGFSIKIVIFPFSVLINSIYKNIPNNFLLFILIIPKFTFVYFIYFATFNIFSISNVNLMNILFYSVIITSVIHSFICLYCLNLKSLIINYSLSNSFFFISPIFYKSVFYFTNFVNYSIIYFINLFCFFVLIFIFCSTKNFYIKNVNNLISLYYTNKTLTFIIIVNLLSLVSIPPFYGFFAKLYMFYFIIEYKFYTLYFILSIINLFLVYCFVRIIRLFFIKKNNSSLKFIKIEKNFLSYIVIFFTATNILALFLFDFVFIICFLILNTFIIL